MLHHWSLRMDDNSQHVKHTKIICLFHVYVLQGTGFYSWHYVISKILLFIQIWFAHKQMALWQNKNKGAGFVEELMIIRREHGAN